MKSGGSSVQEDAGRRQEALAVAAVEPGPSSDWSD